MCRRINIDQIHCIVYMRMYCLLENLPAAKPEVLDLQGNSQIHLDEKSLLSKDAVIVELGRMCTLQEPD